LACNKTIPKVTRFDCCKWKYNNIAFEARINKVQNDSKIWLGFDIYYLSTFYVYHNYCSHLAEAEYNYLDQHASISEMNQAEPMEVKRTRIDSCDDQITVAWALLQTVIQTG
jgi:hypothetical protein